MKLSKPLFFFTIFFIAFSGTLSAQDPDYKKGQKLLMQGKFAEAIQSFETSIKENNSHLSKATLGSMYTNGLGVKKDYRKAFDLFSEAAAEGNFIAIRELSCLYRYGLGVKADPAKAFKLSLQAAQKGSSYACIDLGFTYFLGYPPAPQNMKKAETYFKKAAAGGHTQAKIMLAHLYLDEPESVTPDYELTLKYMDSIDKKDPFYWAAMTIKGTMYYKGKGVPCDKEQAMEYFNQVINSNNAMALNNYACFLADENLNLQQAQNHIQKALILEPLNAAYIDTYGYILYKQGNYKEALKKFQLSAKYYTNFNCEMKKHIGDTYHALGEDDKALKAWTEAFQLPGGNEKLKSELIADYIIATMKQQRTISLTPEKKGRKC